MLGFIKIWSGVFAICLAIIVAILSDQRRQSPHEVIAFYDRPQTTTRLGFVDVDGGHERFVPLAADGIAVRHLVWNPSGTSIVGVSQTAAARQLFGYDYTGSRGLRWLTPKSPFINYDSPTWSSDGRAIAFASNENSVSALSDIFVLDLRTALQTRLTTANPEDFSPVWSPNGEWIAYLASQAGNTEVYVIRAADGQRWQLTFNDFRDLFPTWSPDSEWIAFIGSPQDRSFLYRIRPTGFDFEVLAYLPDSAASLQWSPDGRWLSFVGNTERTNTLYLYNLGSGAITPLFARTLAWLEYTWSADSEWIAFTTSISAEPQVYKIRIDGTDLQPLTQTPTMKRTPAWSPVVDRPWRPTLLIGIVLIGFGGFFHPMLGRVIQSLRPR